MEIARRILKIKKLLTLAAISVLFAACSDTGPEDVRFRSGIVEGYKGKFLEQSKPYFGDVLSDKADSVNTSIEKLSYSNGGDTVAVCNLYLRGGQVISRAISMDERMYWETVEYDKKQVFIGDHLYGDVLRSHILFHEFGHCILDRLKHSCAKDPETQTPKSIMNPYIKATEKVYYDFQAFMDELFMNSPLYQKLPDGSNGHLSKPPPKVEPCLSDEGQNLTSRDLFITFETKCRILPFTEEGREGRHTCWHESSEGDLE